MRRAVAIALLAAAVLALLAVPASAAQQQLRVAVSGSGAGTVSSAPAGITCADACEAAFPEGSLVKLSGEPNGGSEAVIWASCPGSVNAAQECEVTMDAAKEARAVFVLGWHSEQPQGPGGRTYLGEVGDIECYAANRCMLITAGNPGMPAGLYAYDGAGWYQYSTVCGGHHGRIAWAGPDDFWTISDLQVKPQNPTDPSQNISLCHFKDGAVVASYAEPASLATSYQKMSSAACLGPEECWFAGRRLPLGSANVGAFHLFWNGISVAQVPSQVEAQPELEDPGRSVVSLAFHDGALYESVAVQAEDEAPGESPEQPAFLHRVVPGAPPSFLPEVPTSPIDFGGAQPEQLQGFLLSDGGESLWAVSGAQPPATPIALRLGPSEQLEQMALSDPSGAFAPGDVVTGLAAEPGAQAAWVAFRLASDGEATETPARLARIRADGTVEPQVELPPAGESLRGSAGPIECPTAGQCWLATNRGWLFHLGPDVQPNEDPAMHELITFRPTDASVPTVPPTALPEDNSGSEENKGEEPFEIEPEPQVRRVPPLYSHLREHLLKGNVLELSFLLRKRSHVRLTAYQKRQVVARTRDYTMGQGRRSVRLKLDPDHWPTRLALEVKPIEKRKSK